MQAEKKVIQVDVFLAALQIDRSALALELGLERSAVSKVLSFTRTNKPVRELVANALGEKVKALILNESPESGQ